MISWKHWSSLHNSSHFASRTFSSFLFPCCLCCPLKTSFSSGCFERHLKKNSTNSSNEIYRHHKFSHRCLKKLFFCHHWLHFSIIMGQKVFFTSKELLLGEGSFALVPSFQKILFPQKILRWTSWEWNYSMTHFSISWCPPVDHFAHDIVICTSGWRAVLPMDMCVWIPDPQWISNPILVSWWVLLLFLG